jgi:hypothetical protein
LELKTKDEIRNEILQEWLRNAWVYPQQGPDEQQYLRLTPGGRLKLRRRIGEMESSIGVSGRDLLKQEESGEIPAEREKLELAMAVQAYTSERQLIQSQGGSLGASAISAAEDTTEQGTGEGEAGGSGE